MKRAASRDGFTLTELMVASAISAILVLSLVSMFVQQRKSYKSMQLMTEMDQNLRVALDTVSRDLRMAGHGMNVRASDFATWMSWANVTSAVQVTQGSSGDPDTLKITGALDEAPGRIAAAVASGSTTITLGSGQGSSFSTGDRRVILVGKTETARITGVSGDTLTISTDPVTSGRALRNSYPVGAPVELVKVVTYSIQEETYNYPYMPFLRRNDSTISMTYEWQRMASCAIEDLQLTQTGRLVQVTMTARATQRDPNYLNPSFNDRYRRRTVTAEVRIRKPEMSF